MLSFKEFLRKRIKRLTRELKQSKKNYRNLIKKTQKE